MGHQSNPIMPHEMWLELFWSKLNWTVYFLWAVFRFRFIACNQIQSFNLVGVLPSSIWVLNHKVGFSWQPQSKKPFNRLNVLFWACALRSFYFLCFLSCRMETLQQAPNVWRVNTQISHDATFVHYPFFALNVPLFSLFIKLSLIRIFSVICLFCHTLTAHNETRTRQYTGQGRI